MNIPHLTRQKQSAFYAEVHRSIPGTRPLPKGTTLTCTFPTSGGYSGDIVVDIVAGSDFKTNWRNSNPDDWSRFPARIRAAATALRDSGLRGKFRITHIAGSLAIVPL